jgi:hypothetical protein
MPEKARGGTMIPYGYGQEKLLSAVSTLAGTRSLKDRVRDAISYNLIHIEPERDLPGALREDFKAFMAEMTSQTAAGDEGSIQATVDTLGDVKLTGAADNIIWFYGEVCRHRGISAAQGGSAISN